MDFCVFKLKNNFVPSFPLSNEIHRRVYRAKTHLKVSGQREERKGMDELTIEVEVEFHSLSLRFYFFFSHTLHKLTHEYRDQVRIIKNWSKFTSMDTTSQVSYEPAPVITHTQRLTAV